MPLGFFVLLGMSSGADGSKEEFDHFCWVELKHGHVATLAVAGFLVTHAGVHFPGTNNTPPGFAILDNLPGTVWVQMIATWTMKAANQDQ